MYTLPTWKFHKNMQEKDSLTVVFHHFHYQFAAIPHILHHSPTVVAFPSMGLMTT